MKIIKRELFGGELRLDHLKFVVFPELSDREFDSLRYHLEVHRRDITVRTEGNQEYWKLTKNGERSTYNDGVDLCKLTYEEISEAVIKGERVAAQRIEYHKEYNRRYVEQYFTSQEQVGKLIENRDEALDTYFENQQFAVEGGVDDIIKEFIAEVEYAYLDHNDHNEEGDHYPQFKIYSPTNTNAVFEGPKTPISLLKYYVEHHFDMWYKVVAINQLIEEKISGRLLSPSRATIMISTKVFGGLLKELKVFFPEQEKTLGEALRGKPIDTPLRFTSNQNKLVDVFARLKYWGHIPNQPKEIISWISDSFMFKDNSGAFVNFKRSTVMSQINSRKGEPTKKERILHVDWLPFLPAKT